MAVEMALRVLGRVEAVDVIGRQGFVFAAPADLEALAAVVDYVAPVLGVVERPVGGDQQA